jgi:hypothetical protein
MKVGLEKEFFLVDDKGQPVDLTELRSLPCDECGWLVEARGLPFRNDIIEAVFSLKASIYRIEQELLLINARQKSAGLAELTLTDNPVMKVSRDIRLKCARKFTKSLIKYQNFYGYQSHRHALTEATAGIHISLTSEVEVYHGNEKHIYNRNFDWPQIFVKLDKAFAEEIKAAKRRPGFYELKPDGRVEYRSLPANANLDKVMEVLSHI